MKLCGVAMVRNEEDIVETFVRHNLTVLDGLLVVDHGSSDRTLDVLRALCEERLPLIVTRNESPGYLQAEIMTTAARDVFARVRADIVFPLDADEFLHVPSRERLERALADLPPGHTGRLAWPTFVPSFDRPGRDMPSILRGTRRLAREAPAPEAVAAKTVLPRWFADLPDAYLVMGSHHVVLGRDLATATHVPQVDLDPAIVRLCHVPVRSRTQYVVKTAVSHLALMAAGRWFGPGATRRREYEELRGGGRLDAGAMLRRYIVGAADVVPGTPAMPETVADAFLAPIALRYSPSLPDDALPQVLSAIEHMTRRLARLPREGATARAGARRPGDRA